VRALEELFVAADVRSVSVSMSYVPKVQMVSLSAICKDPQFSIDLRSRLGERPLSDLVVQMREMVQLFPPKDVD
jgi:hypothetical protein